MTYNVFGGTFNLTQPNHGIIRLLSHGGGGQID